MAVEAETDGTLIERSCRGRPDAFVEVVRRHETAVHAFLARRAGPQVAADLLGEVWLRAFAGRGGYDPAHQDARPWLYGIARNVLRAHWRARPRSGGRAGDRLGPVGCRRRPPGRGGAGGDAGRRAPCPAVGRT